MSDDNNVLNFLNAPPPELPPQDAMVEFGLEILTHSSIGIELYEVVRDNNIKIKIIQGKEERSYIGDKDQVVIALSAVNPARPARFILLLTGAIREIMQEYEGLPTPLDEPDLDSVIQKMSYKLGQQAGYMCAVAYEINEIESFHKYYLVDELKKMGYEKDWNTFILDI